VLLTEIQIKNFRCFSQISLELKGPLVLIQGVNGSGKTSLLEALHYLCFLRSFRTHSPRDLIHFGSEGFFIKAQIDDAQSASHEIQVGFAGKKRLVKINQKAISSYKELMDYYRIVTITEDDLHLISSGPEIRRAFIDQALLLDDPEFIQIMRNYKHIVDSRNALLAQGRINLESYTLWTDQLWATSRILQERRIAMLGQLQDITNQMLAENFNDPLSVAFAYSPKKVGPEVDEIEFKAMQPGLYAEETRFARSLFGAHLDDFVIKFQDKKSKVFASRGQQKLIVLLMKVAQMKHIGGNKGGNSTIFLLDDFMTDFDPGRAHTLLDILCGLENQLIFTSPIDRGSFEDKLSDRGAYQVKLTP